MEGAARIGHAASSRLGLRNALYGLQLGSTLTPAGWRRFAVAQLTIDESTAVAVSQATTALRRLGFWVTGFGVYTVWNGATLAGGALGEPKQFGLDAAASASFMALLWPRLHARESVAIAIVAAMTTTVLVPAIPQGLPVLAARLWARSSHGSGRSAAVLGTRGATGASG